VVSRDILLAGSLNVVDVDFKVIYISDAHPGCNEKPFQLLANMGQFAVRVLSSTFSDVLSSDKSDFRAQLRLFHKATGVSIELVLEMVFAKFVFEISSRVYCFRFVPFLRFRRLSLLTSIHRSGCFSSSRLGFFFCRGKRINKFLTSSGSD
jgi:hypothetical protein